ncbi:hypothetical protein [Prescottella agglutinans]|uniref:Uncharacterized protein n=1 Tax=Prescottella agglutinans TaxID=1644129 RepID=A0ABT6MJG7_9NOCA|nr:hypothetical protein [Prescottella agglutinans]MDH6283494.1 hypothetical protein [Prescottella agglutinans]
MGSIVDAVKIPFGSADAVLAGVINSINVTLTGINNVVGQAYGSVADILS